MLIHHMWFQGFEFSPVSMAEIKDQCWGPAIEHMFWDEKKVISLLQDHYPEWIGMFTKLPMVILKCDVSRAFILHHYGGGYADVDFEPLSTFSETLDTIPLDGITVPEYFSLLGWRFPNNNLIFCHPRHSYWIQTYLPHVENFLLNGGSWFTTWISMLYPPITVFSWSGPIALHSTCPQLNILSNKTSTRLGYNPGFSSNWIQYRVVFKHLVLGLCASLAVVLVFLWSVLSIKKVWIKVMSNSVQRI
jgi:hypothetical protein